MAAKRNRKRLSPRSLRRVHLAARSANLTAADRDLLAVPKADWAFAKRQERIAKSALRVGAMEAARSTGCSKRTIYRLLASYRMNPTLLAFLPRRRGSAVGSRRLDLDREAIIAQAVEQWMSSREPLPVARAVEEAARLAKAAGLKAVARNSIVRRLLAQGGNPNRRLSSLERRVLPDIPKTRRALGIVQADHTPVDLILVDDINRQPIGRPWITIIFDVASRAVLGFHATLEAPSATSVAMALSMACLPKSKWLNALEIEADWPMYGIPEVLHLDNASEFHSEALRRGCERYGIRLDYRPPGQPYTGGHIERYLGTLMRRIHGVPGTTMSNVKERGTYKSEKHASLSLQELESWLTLEIAGRYHHAIHRGLHMTPTAAWTRAVGRRPILSPELPERFALDFLPVISRKIGRSGFQLFHIRYWDPLLSRLFTDSQRLFVRYDPRNLARVWVPIPARGEYLAVPYADLRRPPISQSEQQAAMREIQATGRRTANEDAIFSTIELQRRLIDRARSTTKTRRLRARQPAASPAIPTLIPSSASTIDYSKPAIPFPSETWSN
jgi:putative transposase